MSSRVIIGDCRDVLPTLEAGSVQCCVTSPPYWGLRDYGTAKWEGGDSTCEHTGSGRYYTEQSAGACGTDAFSEPGEANAARLKKARWRESGICTKCGAEHRDCQLGLEKTPEEYVANMVEVFRLARDLLADDGTLFLNLGDSYFSNPAKGGSGTFNGRNGAGEGYARGKRAAPCDTSDKEPANSQARDCLCGSLCDACRKAYRIGKSRSDSRHVPMQSPSPSATSREHMESQCGHLPTSDSANQVDRNEAAIPDAARSPIHAGEPLPASPVSTNPECAPQHLGQHSAASTPDGECRLCGRSLHDCVPASARMEDCTCDTEGGGSADRRIDTDVSDSAYLHCTTASLKPKDLCGIPWMVAFALRADGWYLRQDIIWHKPNPIPESVRDRCTKSHEYLFLMAKSEKYYFDADAIAEESVTKDGRKPYARGQVDARGNGHDRGGGEERIKTNRDQGARWNTDYRNKRSVWTVGTMPYTDAHFATFPPALIEPSILAGSRPGDIVLDPFGGSGTTGQVAEALGRKWLLIELNGEYGKLCADRTRQTGMVLT